MVRVRACVCACVREKVDVSPHEEGMGREI